MNLQKLKEIIDSLKPKTNYEKLKLIIDIIILIVFLYMIYINSYSYNEGFRAGYEAGIKGFLNVTIPEIKPLP